MKAISVRSDVATMAEVQLTPQKVLCAEPYTTASGIQQSLRLIAALMNSYVPFC